MKIRGSLITYIHPPTYFTSQKSGGFSFRVATRNQTRIKEIKTSLRISTEAVGIAYEKTQREEVHSTLLPSDVLIETSYISVDDHFAALQIDLSDWGWKTFGGFAVQSNQFPNYSIFQ